MAAAASRRRVATASLQLVDAHCHIHDARFHALERQTAVPPPPSTLHALGPVLRRAIAANVAHLVSCACHEADWSALETLLAQWDSATRSTDCGSDGSSSLFTQTRRMRLTPSFGVHPWWANEARGDYMTRLRETLARHPLASVGEIGLCKSSRGQAVPVHVQETAFCEQLALATELARPCVIHCVGRYGRLLELLQTALRAHEALPPTLVLHSYAGGAALAASFLALERNAQRTRVFFSLNAKQLSDARSDKAAATCAAIPLRSLLLETDAPDQVPDASVVHDARGAGVVAKAEAEAERERERVEDAPSRDATMMALSSRLNEPALVAIAYARAAAIRGLALPDLAAAVYENASCAFCVREDGR